MAVAAGKGNADFAAVIQFGYRRTLNLHYQNVYGVVSPENDRGVDGILFNIFSGVIGNKPVAVNPADKFAGRKRGIKIAQI